MGSLSIWHWLIVLVFIISYVWPVALIIKKAGFSPWWVLLMFVPIGNIIGLWLLATAKWPRNNGVPDKVFE